MNERPVLDVNRSEKQIWSIWFTVDAFGPPRSLMYALVLKQTAANLQVVCNAPASQPLTIVVDLAECLSASMLISNYTLNIKFISHLWLDG